MSTDELISIGRAGKAHGTGGEVRIRLASRYLEPFSKMGRVFLRRGDGQPRAARIESSRRHQDVLLVKLDIAHDRSAAQELVGVDVYATSEELIQAGWDGPFPEQILGLPVFTEEGASVGVVDDVLEYPAGELYLVRDGEREHLIPAVPEMIKAIDLENRRMVIRPTPGLLDLSS